MWLTITVVDGGESHRVNMEDWASHSFSSGKSPEKGLGTGSKISPGLHQSYRCGDVVLQAASRCGPPAGCN